MLRYFLTIAAPAPAAVVIGIRLYQQVVAASSSDWWLVAGITAVIGCVGTMGIEITTYEMAGKAFAQREFKAAFLAVLLAITCSALVVYAVWSGDNSRSLVTVIVVSIIGYVTKSIYDYLQSRKKENAQAYAQGVQLQVSQTNNQVALLQAQAALEHEKTLQARADARKAKAEQGAVRSVRQRTKPNRELDAERLALFAASYKKHPEWTIRQHGAACGVASSDTASRYLAAAKQQPEKQA